MNVFSTAPARNRTTAFVVLILWMFTVGAGIVNACMLDARQAYTANSVESLTKVTAAHSMVASHGRALPDHVDDSDRSGLQCLKVCDNSVQTPPKLQSGIDQTPAAQMPPPSAFWPALAPAVVVSDGLDEVLPIARAVPIRIRFARLAL